MLVFETDPSLVWDHTMIALQHLIAANFMCWRAYVGGILSRTHCARVIATRQQGAATMVPPLVARLYMGLRSGVCFLPPSCMTYT